MIDGATTKVIGAGAFGKVYRTHRKFAESTEVAIKVLDKHQLMEDIKMVEDEIGILT